MEEKIEVGEYVRTRKGYIAKVKQIICKGYPIKELASFINNVLNFLQLSFFLIISILLPENKAAVSAEEYKKHNQSCKEKVRFPSGWECQRISPSDETFTLSIWPW